MPPPFSVRSYTKGLWRCTSEHHRETRMASALFEEGDNGAASETKDGRRLWKAMSIGTSRVRTKLSELLQT